MKHINLLPESVRAQRRRRSLLRCAREMSVLSGVILVLFGLMIGISLHRMDNEISDLRSATDEAGKMNTLRAQQLAEYQRAINIIEVERRLSPRIPATELMNLVASALPDEAFLSGVSWTSVAPEVPEIDDPGAKKDRTRSRSKARNTDATGRCEIVGIARDEKAVGEFLAALKKAEAFSTVQLTRSEQTEIRDVTLHRFTVEATVDPNTRFERVQIAGADDAS